MQSLRIREDRLWTADDLLRTRERLRSISEADDWARAEDVDQLTADERDQIQQAAAIVRKARQGFLGMPRVRQPLPDHRPERPA
ncbi:hypothetical protein [Streptomyces lydicus]|uniref:hypothetical protein n=1 Tax=Streptomyces lydicus TaxID=47763 RepID=UPI0036E87473